MDIEPMLLRRIEANRAPPAVPHLRKSVVKLKPRKEPVKKTAVQRRLEKLHDNIVQRCTNPNNPAYSWYGGREDGPPIKFHGPWRGRRKLFIKELLAEIGPPRHRSDSLDRINRNGNYEPGNIKWSTKSEQAANRNSTRVVEVNGVSVLSPDAARALGKTPDALRKL